MQAPQHLERDCLVGLFEHVLLNGDCRGCIGGPAHSTSHHNNHLKGRGVKQGWTILGLLTPMACMTSALGRERGISISWVVIFSMELENTKSGVFASKYFSTATSKSSRYLVDFLS